MQDYQSETEGTVALRRLQNNDFKLWTKKEIEESDLSDKSKQASFYVARKNSFQIIPSPRDVKNFLKTSESNLYNNILKPLKKHEIVFSITIPEVVGYYNLVENMHCGHFRIPTHLDWFEPYLNECREAARHSSRMSWNERIKRGRPSRYERRLVANIKDENGLPYYLPLGLHKTNF